MWGERGGTPAGYIKTPSSYIKTAASYIKTAASYINKVKRNIPACYITS